MSSQAQREQSGVIGTGEPETAAPVAPATVEQAPQTVYVASQWRLMWWKFKRHKLAMIGAVVVILLYLVAILAEFLAPADPNLVASTYTYAPPQTLRLFTTNDDGLQIGLHVFGLKSEIDKATLSRTFTIDETQRIPVGFFVRGHEYKLFGLIPMDRQLNGPKDP